MIKLLNKADYQKILFLGKKINDEFDLKKIYDNEIIYTYCYNNRIIGFIQISFLYEILEIINIVVDNEMRRNKVGTKLLEYVIGEYNPKQILLEVNEKNKEAIEFYKKNKFENIRTIKNYYCTSDALVMERRFF